MDTKKNTYFLFCDKHGTCTPHMIYYILYVELNNIYEKNSINLSNVSKHKLLIHNVLPQVEKIKSYLINFASRVQY